jgi:hypothetical protein
VGGPTGAAGSTGGHGSPGGPTGTSGANDPQTVAINPGNVLDQTAGQTKFVYGTGGADGVSGTVSGGQNSLGQDGNLGVAKLLGAGGQLSTDLTNFGNLVGSLNPGGDGSSFGSAAQPTPQIAGIGAAGNLDSGGRPELKDLLTNNASLEPRH